MSLVDNPHRGANRCSNCSTERERCDSCRYKCACGKKCISKNAFKQHCKKSNQEAIRFVISKQAHLTSSSTSTETEVPTGTAKQKKVKSVEYMQWCFARKCCKQLCIQNWTWRELNSQLIGNASLPDKEKCVLTVNEEDDSGDVM